jgi:hypothetical protein
MSETPTSNQPPLPEGDENPDRLFAAVGHAITQWELLELEFAALYTIFEGMPRRIDAMRAYGNANPTVRFRLSALEEAADRHFVRQPDQSSEGEFVAIVRRARELTIERHRVAHGVISALPVIRSEDADENGFVWIGQHVRYFLGAPWYSTETLGMHFAALSSREIDAHAISFAELRARIAALNQRLAPEP